MSLGARLSRLRQNRGESLQQTADAVGTSKGHLWQIERGKADKPTITLVTALASHFGVTVGSLVGEDPSAEDADLELAAMFRDASRFSGAEREILRGMMKTLSEQAARREQKS